MSLRKRLSYLSSYSFVASVTIYFSYSLSHTLSLYLSFSCSLFVFLCVVFLLHSSVLFTFYFSSYSIQLWKSLLFSVSLSHGICTMKGHSVLSDLSVPLFPSVVCALSRDIWQSLTFSWAKLLHCYETSRSRFSIKKELPANPSHLFYIFTKL